MPGPSRRAQLVLCSVVDSRRLARVSMQAELLYMKILVASDDAGRFYGSPFRVAAALFGARMERNELTHEVVGAWLRELENVELIERYSGADGDPYLAVRNLYRPVRADRRPVIRFPAADDHPQPGDAPDPDVVTTGSRSDPDVMSYPLPTPTPTVERETRVREAFRAALALVAHLHASGAVREAVDRWASHAAEVSSYHVTRESARAQLAQLDSASGGDPGKAVELIELALASNVGRLRQVDLERWRRPASYGSRPSAASARDERSKAAEEAFLASFAGWPPGERDAEAEVLR